MFGSAPLSEKENTQFFRRTLCLGLLQLALILILLGRLYVFQILEGYHYHLLAEGNRIATRPLLPLRGQIYDRHGTPLTQNVSTFRLVLLTARKDKVEDALTKLSTLIPLSAQEKEEILKTIRKKRGLDAIIIKDNLTWPEVSLLELHANQLPGVSIEVGSARTYPVQQQGAHILGYVSSPSEQEQAEDSMLSLPGLKVGKGGLEKYFDSRLRGTPGYSAFEVNARRKVVRELHQVPSHPGEDIHTTLDGRLQTYAQELLSTYESATAIVLDVNTGDVLAFVSTPSFDPNLFPSGIRHKDWNALRDNPYRPLINKGISGLYPPGSTLKPFVILAALNAGIITADTKIHCPGYMTLGNHKFHCWHVHGPVNVSEALSQSCDIFFYELAKKMGINILAPLLQDMGLETGGIDVFPARKKGLVPTKEWKKEHKHKSWTVSDTILSVIGQGYMLATPLELAVATSRLVSGKRITPRFEKKGPPLFSAMDYDPEHRELILQAMSDVVNSPYGTAYRRRIPYQGYEMGGKTGTSQVRRISAQDRQAGRTKTYHLDWAQREHGLFVGYAPIENPRYVVTVVVEHSGGSGAAVQIARDLLLKAQVLERKPKP